MIQIAYRDDGDRFELSADGHAGQAAEGHDIVCSAVSTLVQTLIARLDETGEEYRAELRKGHAEIDGPAAESFRTVLTGLKEISRAYPEYVKVTRRG